jgi:hypothetical protein
MKYITALITMDILDSENEIEANSIRFDRIMIYWRPNVANAGRLLVAFIRCEIFVSNRFN